MKNISIKIIGGFALAFLSVLTASTSYADVSCIGSGSIDTGFNAGGSGFDYAPWWAQAQTDGKLVVAAGYFTTYNGVTAASIVRLNANGSKDINYNIYGETVYSIALQSDNKVVERGIGGSTGYFRRFNTDGSIDTNFNVGGAGFGAGINAGPSVLTLQSDGKILAGGYFTTYNGTARRGLVRINTNGSIDTTFSVGAGFDTPVINGMLVQPDGKVIVAGTFTSYNSTTRNRIVRLNTDGTIDTGFTIGNGFNSDVNNITIQPDGKILVNGQFSSYSGTSVGHLVRLNTNGTLDSSFNLGTLPASLAYSKIILQTDGKIIIGLTDSSIVRLNSDGSLDSSLHGSFSGPINYGGYNYMNLQTMILTPDNQLLVIGRFTTYNNSPARGIAKVLISYSGPQNGPNGYCSDTTGTVCTTTSTPIISCSLSDVGTAGVCYVPSNNGTTLAATNGSGSIQTGGNIDTGFNVGSSGFTGGSNTNMGISPSLWVMTQQSDGKIVAGGNFTLYNGVTQNNIVRLNTDGSIDNTFNIGSGFNRSVLAITQQPDGKLLVGGYFTAYNGVTKNNLVRLNSDGSIDSTFNIGNGFDGGNGMVQAISLQSDGKIIVGGPFFTYNGVSKRYIVRLNTDGSIDNTFNIGSGFSHTQGYDASVTAIAIQSDGKVLLGGHFTTYNGTSSNRIIRLNTDGSIDNTFSVGNGFNNMVEALVLQPDEKVVVAGRFTTYNGTTKNRIIRLNSDGSIDSTFNIGNGFDANAMSLTLQNDGKIIVGGYGFTTYNSQSSNNIIRLNSDGSIDSTFNVGAGISGSYKYVKTVLQQADGNLLLGGNFSSYNNQPTPGNFIKVHSYSTLGDMVGINTISPRFPLDVNGSIRAAAVLQVSDARLKSSIIKIDDALSKISQINGYQFTWLDSGKPDIGVLAQEVEKVFTYAVQTDVDGKKAVQYSALLAPVIQAIHEINTIVDEQTAKATAQSKRISSLEKASK